MTSIKRLVAFAILMESGGGIENKVPDYVLSKFEVIMTLPEDLITQPLDHNNKAKFREYLKKWKLE